MKRFASLGLSLGFLSLLIAQVCADDPQNEQKDKIKAAVRKGVAYLKSTQKEGNWDTQVLNMGGGNLGGVTALATLALLESGEKPDDPAVKSALEYIRKLPPAHTYTTSLHTLCYCKADPKLYGTEIQANVAWLVKTAVREKGKVVGWSYPISTTVPISAVDLSNTHFAVEALSAAARAGAKLDPKLWKQIYEALSSTQLATGGWPYTRSAANFGGGERLNMTAAAVECLATAKARLPEGEQVNEEGLKKGLARLGERLELHVLKGEYPYYRLMVIRMAGRSTGLSTFTQGEKEINWYRDGADALLKGQRADGSWAGANQDGIPVIATSLALRFLAD